MKMNISIKEFQRIVEEEKGTVYIYLSASKGSYFCFRSLRDDSAYYLATVRNEIRYFKSLSALDSFLRQYFPEKHFKVAVI